MTKNNKLTGSNEWAPTTENIFYGCQHGCRYCYAKEAICHRFKKYPINDWGNPTLKALKPGSRESYFRSKRFRKRDGRIMFPSTHDIHPDNIDECIYFLSSMMRAGNNVLVVSKPHLSCIKKICRSLGRFRNQIIFRFTIGSMDDSVLRFWEPNAPDFTERYESLHYAYKMGFRTSVSCEPMLDTVPKTVGLVNKLDSCVTETIWIGKMNRLARCKTNNVGPGRIDEAVLRKAVDHIKENQSDVNIFDLYGSLRYNDKVRWKESIKMVLGIPLTNKQGEED